MKKVCFDLTALEMVDRQGGIGRYCHQLFAALRTMTLPFELHALVSSAAPALPARRVDLDALSHAPLVAVNRHRFQRRLLAPLLLKDFDLFHSTTTTALPLGVRSVATVYDLITLDMPYPGRSLGARARRLKANGLERIRLRRPEHLIAISEVTKASTLRWSKRKAQDITVTPLAIDHARFRPTDASAVRAKYGLPERYIVSVGSDHYRKNQTTLFEAWMKSGAKEALVLVGKTIYGEIFPRLQSEARGAGVGDKFFWLANVSDDELPAFYSGALCAVAPSKSEGFGLTVLEAMASGAPLIAADQPAYREVSGDAAIFFSPEDADALSAHLLRLQAPGEREAWSERGLAHAALYTWEACAEATVSVYEQLLR